MLLWKLWSVLLTSEKRKIGMGLMPILTGITKAVPIGLGLPLIPRLPFVGRVCTIFVVVSGVCRRNNTAYYTLTDLSGSG